FFNNGNERSIRAKKNIVAMVFLKGLSILISLLLVPMTIDYVDVETYGVWLTISSVVTWIGFFDIGVNNGLKNKFAEAKALDQHDLAQRYVSTTYAILSLIFIPIIILFASFNSLIDWAVVFNLDAKFADSLSTSMLIVVGFFCLKFILSTINVIIVADQKPAEASLRALIENAVSLVIIFALTKFADGSLLKLCLALCVAPIIVLAFFNISLFRGRYRQYRPMIKKIDFSLLPDVFKLGVKFFIIQIAMIIQFQATNLIIIRSFGAADVTLYNVTYKYFNMLVMIIAIFLAPLWSAVTDAHAKSDNQWILNAVNKYRKITYLLLGVGVLMLLVSELFYKIWLNNPDIKTSYGFSLAMMLYMFSLIIGKVEGTVLNGLGYLKVQMITALIAPIIFCLVAYMGINYLNFGLYSLLIAGILANFNGFILAPIQYRMVYKYHKKGIWIK
ncbi:MAG: hypothetical protein RRY05_09095, partial [Bacteroidales bacterium]